MKSARQRTPNTKPEQKRVLKRKPLLILIAVLFMSNIVLLIAWLTPSKLVSNHGEEVASVAGKVITRESWMATMEEKIGRETLRDMVNEEVMEAAAKEYGIDVKDKEIDLELALIHSRDLDAYTGMNEEKIRKEIRARLILEKVLTKDIVIEKDAIKKSYKENATFYHVQEAYRTSLIVVNTLEDAEQTIAELKDGSSFEVLAKERSIDSASANLGGDIGYINENTDLVDPQIIDVVANLTEGQISEPLTLKDGVYAIATVNGQIEGRKFKLKEVREHISRELALEQLPEQVNPEAFWKDFNTTWFYER